MVFAHVIEPFPEGKPAFPLTSTTNKQAVGDMMLQSQMVGMINALAGLADYTNELFSSLLQESAGISSRIAAIGNRCATLTHKVEETEKAMKISVEAKTLNPRTEFHATVPEHKPLFTKATAPPALRQQYEKSRPPPNLSLLDPYLGGQSGMKSYTDPGFFLEQWLESQARVREETRQYREARRAAREAKRKLEEEEDAREKNQETEKGNGETSGNNNAWDARRPVRMRLYTYDVHTGEKEYVNASPKRRVQKLATEPRETHVPVPNQAIQHPKPAAPHWATTLPQKVATSATAPPGTKISAPVLPPRPVLPNAPNLLNTTVVPGSALPNIPVLPPRPVLQNASVLPNAQVVPHAPVLPNVQVVPHIPDLAQPGNNHEEKLPVTNVLPLRPAEPARIVPTGPNRSNLLLEIEKGINLRPAPQQPKVEPTSIWDNFPYPKPIWDHNYSDSEDDAWSDDWDDVPRHTYAVHG